MFSSVLVANRGEIAVRITGTLRRLGIRSVAVYSDADAGARHVREADLAVRIGPTPARESYLRPEAIVEAALATGADAVHPGYGFLSESPALARACVEAGLVFVGPSAEAIELMGDKIAAKRTVAAAGVATVPGRSEPGLTDADLVEAVRSIGVPALLKPSAGGGGKGMRLIEEVDGLTAVIASARREAAAAFGDDTLFVERYLPVARHLEVQVLADRYGAAVHLGERECSLQRRHQKIVEEAPSPALDDEQRRVLGEQALAVVRACGYENAGTVEFIASATDPGQSYFMEMNTRLQVEHPVTELVWGLDLVEQQLRVAAGERLAFAQDELAPTGHAVEVRLYAEDPDHGFLPSGGELVALVEPTGPGVRVDSGVEVGDLVSSAYDPMLAKLITWGATRQEAFGRLGRALDEFVLLGPTTNLGFLGRLVGLEAVRSGALDTGLVEREVDRLVGGAPTDLEVAAAALWALATLPEEGTTGVWDRSGWRLVGRGCSVWSGACDGTVHRVALLRAGDDAWSVTVDGEVELEVQVQWRGGVLELSGAGGELRTRGVRRGSTLWVAGGGEARRYEEPEPRAAGLGGAEAGGLVTSPMPGQVIDVAVEVGSVVEAGQTLAVVEAMKMEHALAAPTTGVVQAVLVRPGDQVALGQVVIEMGAADVL